MYSPKLQKPPVVMAGETNLSIIIKNMQPWLNEGEYVFCTGANNTAIGAQHIICLFKEKEGTCYVLPRHIADELHLPYSYVAAWITLNVHSSLEAVGLTAAFAGALANAAISCNVIAAFYHDHIFVKKEDAEKAMAVLQKMADAC
jgi:hypothetical protein